MHLPPPLKSKLNFLYKINESLLVSGRAFLSEVLASYRPTRTSQPITEQSITNHLPLQAVCFFFHLLSWKQKVEPKIHSRSKGTALRSTPPLRSASRPLRFSLVFKSTSPLR